MAVRRGIVKGDICHWCAGVEVRRKHKIDVQLKEGILQDILIKVSETNSGRSTDVYRGDLTSNWVCDKCFMLVRSLISAENKVENCQKKLIEQANSTNSMREMDKTMKRPRPLLESPSSQPTQPAKRSLCHKQTVAMLSDLSPEFTTAAAPRADVNLVSDTHTHDYS